MRNISDWKKLEDSLVRAKIAFKAEKTTFTIKFFTPYGDFKYTDKSNENSIPKGELYFIKKVKNHCEKLDLVFEVDRKKIRYIDIAPIKEDIIHTDIFELDLSAAYWNIAYQEGIINKEIFDAGQLIDKKTRLVSLGALAKNTSTLYFDGERWTVKGLIEGPKANYFFRVAQLTSKIMQQLKLISGSDFLFYWVDAIFFKSNSLHAITDHLIKHNLKYKLYPIDKVRRTGEIIYVSSLGWKIEKGKKTDTRTFQLKKDKFNFDNKPQLKAYNHKSVLEKINSQSKKQTLC